MASASNARIKLRSASGQDDRTLVIKDAQISGKSAHVYTLLNRDGSRVRLNGHDVEVEPLGSGAFGVVVRARDRLSLFRVVKIFIGADFSPMDFKKHFIRNEIALSNAEPFKNVIPVTDYGTQQMLVEQETSNGAVREEVNAFWTASQYVNGPTLDTFIETILPRHRQAILGNPTYQHWIHDQMILVLRDLVGALDELYEARVVHMDLKPNNVLIYPRATAPDSERIVQLDDVRLSELTRLAFESYVIDLNSAKRITDDPKGSAPATATPFWTSEALREKIRDPKRKRHIRYEALGKVWKLWDLYSLGRIIEYVFFDLGQRDVQLQNNVAREFQLQKELFWKEILGDDFDILRAIANRLLMKVPTLYGNVREVADDLAVIPLKSEQRVSASELLFDPYPGIRIRTSQALIRVSFPFNKLIDHPSYQRLRNFQQLAFASEILPDSTHSRFSHSLRTFELAKRYITALRRRRQFRLLFKRHDIDVLLASALLHEIGQYPFSHIVEDLRRMGAESNDSRFGPSAHNQNRVRHILDHGGKQSMTRLLAESSIAVEDLLYLLDKGPKDCQRGPVLNISRDIINGTLDVNRLSYLIQDSKATGLPYSGCIDVDSLIEDLTIRYDPTDPMSPQTGLALEEGGVSAVEAVLMSIYWMYRNVYWRHTNRAYVAAIKFVMFKLIKHGYLSYDMYWRYAHRHSDWEALRYLSNKFARFCREHGPGQVNPISDLCNDRRLGYKRVFTLQRNSDASEELYRTLVNEVDLERLDTLLIELANVFSRWGAEHGDILMDIPQRSRMATDDSAFFENSRWPPLWVCRRNQLTNELIDWVEIRDYSHLAAGLGTVESLSSKRVRVFFSRKLLNELPRDILHLIDQNVFESLYAITTKWRSSTTGSTSRPPHRLS